MGQINVKPVEKGTQKGLTAKRKTAAIIINLTDDEAQFADVLYSEFLETPTGETTDVVVNKTYRVKTVAEQLLVAAQAMIDATRVTLENDDRLPFGCPNFVELKPTQPITDATV